MKDVDADYYGYRDEDDGVIVPLEIEAEKKAMREALKAAHGDAAPEPTDDDVLSMIKTIVDDDEEEEFVGPRRFVAHVPSIPSQQEVREEILQRKKRELMRKYTAAAATADDDGGQEQDQDEAVHGATIS